MGAGFWLIDDIVSQGTYDIEVVSGPIYIEANTILKDITANADSGPVVERPSDWPAIYKIGSETPKILLSNTGKAVIEVLNNNN